MKPTTSLVQLIGIIYLVISLISCKSVPVSISSEFETRTIELFKQGPNSKFAEISMSLPVELDTLLTWNDLNGTGTQKYRYTNKDGCLIKENGSIRRNVCRDSIHHVTIEHRSTIYQNSYLNLEEICENAFQYFETMNQDYKIKMYTFIDKDLLKINNREFLILKYNHESLTSTPNIIRSVTEVQTIINNVLVTIKLENTKGILNQEKESASILRIINSIVISR